MSQQQVLKGIWTRKHSASVATTTCQQRGCTLPGEWVSKVPCAGGIHIIHPTQPLWYTCPIPLWHSIPIPLVYLLPLPTTSDIPTPVYLTCTLPLVYLPQVIPTHPWTYPPPTFPGHSPPEGTWDQACSPHGRDLGPGIPTHPLEGTWDQVYRPPVDR